jgi:argininosuccinate synthase
VRFELTYYALKPDIKVIAPWREWDLASRTKLIEFAEKHQIPIAKDKRGEAPFSVDANLLHSSSEGKVLEDPAVEPPDSSISAPSIRKTRPTSRPIIEIDFEKGDAGRDRRQEAVARRAADQAERTRPRQRHRPARSGREPLRRHEVARRLRDAGRHDPARRPSRIESITLDRGAAHLKDELMPRYAELIYNGFWFAPEREMLQAADRQEPGASPARCG